MDTTTRTGTPLRQRMTEDMRMRKLEAETQQAYIPAVRKLTVYLNRSPDTATVEDLRNFQLHLVDSGSSRSLSQSAVPAPAAPGLSRTDHCSWSPPSGDYLAVACRERGPRGEMQGSGLRQRQQVAGGMNLRKRRKADLHSGGSNGYGYAGAGLAGQDRREGGAAPAKTETASLSVSRSRHAAKASDSLWVTMGCCR